MKKDVFADNITRIDQMFGDRILELISNIFTSAIETSFNI